MLVDPRSYLQARRPCLRFDCLLRLEFLQLRGKLRRLLLRCVLRGERSLRGCAARAYTFNISRFKQIHSSVDFCRRKVQKQQDWRTCRRMRRSHRRHHTQAAASWTGRTP